MNIHEYQSAKLFNEYNIRVPENRPVSDVLDALAFAEEKGFPIVLKAQVLTGGRGKAGGVKKVNNKKELQDVFPKILGMDIKGHKVKKILAVRAIEIKKEIYLGITLDMAKGDIVLIASKKGGMDIEQAAKEYPKEIHKIYVGNKKEIVKNNIIDFLAPVFGNDKDTAFGAEVMAKLFKLFIEKDCTLIEINPFARDNGGVWLAADAKINFDDNALYRHPEIESLRDADAEDADEVAARNAGLSFVKLDGEIGCIVNGAGLAMATMDVIKNLGGQPLNFLDVGGSSSPNKVINALKIILKSPKLKAILINIFGGITRCDDVANGIIEAQKQLKIQVPLVVRLTGTNESLAKDILSKNGINTYISMREAVLKVVNI